MAMAWHWARARELVISVGKKSSVNKCVRPTITLKVDCPLFLKPVYQQMLRKLGKRKKCSLFVCKLLRCKTLTAKQSSALANMYIGIYTNWQILYLILTHTPTVVPRKLQHSLALSLTYNKKFSPTHTLSPHMHVLSLSLFVYMPIWM